MKTSLLSKTLAFILGAVLIAVSTGTSNAASSDNRRIAPPTTPAAPPTAQELKKQQADELFTKGRAALASKKYTDAVKIFTDADKLDPNNPDILNELAYSNRKLGKLDLAFTIYDRALKLRPHFPEAREYLGEAHLQAALRELQTLKSYGKESNEETEELTKAIQAAAAQLDEKH